MHSKGEGSIAKNQKNKKTHKGYIYGYHDVLNLILLSETLALNQVGRALGFFPYHAESILY